jgi:hypothetical protein
MEALKSPQTPHKAMAVLPRRARARAALRVVFPKNHHKTYPGGWGHQFLIWYISLKSGAMCTAFVQSRVALQQRLFETAQKRPKTGPSPQMSY